MADTNLSSVAGVLKRAYDDYVETQQNLTAKAIDTVAKSLKKYSPDGEGYFGSIDEYGNEAGGAINEEEQFRTIDSESYQQWKVVPKVIVWPIQFSGLISKAAEGGEESFANAVVDALDKARIRMKKDENRQFFGSGTGVLSTVGRSVASNLTSFTVSNAQYLRANMVLDLFTSAGGAAVVSSWRLSDVDKINNIVFSAVSLGTAVVTTTAIGKENIFDSMPADGKEMMGLNGISDDATDITTFQNLDASAKRIWRGLRISAASANLTSDLLQRLEDDIEVLGGEEIDTFIMHRKQRRKYLDIVVPQKRYMDGKMDSGFSELSFNGKTMLLDDDCQVDQVYAFKKSMIRKFELSPLEMASHDGSDIFLRLSNFDVFQAYWRHYCNFGTSKRNATGKLVLLATPSGVS